MDKYFLHKFCSPPLPKDRLWPWFFIYCKRCLLLEFTNLKLKKFHWLIRFPFEVSTRNLEIKYLDVLYWILLLSLDTWKGTSFTQKRCSDRSLRELHSFRNGQDSSFFLWELLLFYFLENHCECTLTVVVTQCENLTDQKLRKRLHIIETLCVVF